MAQFSIKRDYLAHLIAKVRGLQAREDAVDVDLGSNAADDNKIDAVQETGVPARPALAAEYWSEGAARLGLKTI